VVREPPKGALGLGQAVPLGHGPQQVERVEVGLVPVAPG
jgi:hypothetical protein